MENKNGGIDQKEWNNWNWKYHYTDRFKLNCKERTETHGISKKEVQESMHNIEVDIAGGEDNMEPEMIKHPRQGGKDFTPYFCNLVSEEIAKCDVITSLVFFNNFVLDVRANKRVQMK